MAIPYNKERRVAPRYDDKIQVDLILEDNNILPVEICSISIKGLQIICDGWLADEIEPQGIQRLALSRKNLTISASLPVNGNNQPVLLHSTVVAVRRLSQDKFLIGLEYKDIADNDEIVLNQYIEQLRLHELNSQQLNNV